MGIPMTDGTSTHLPAVLRARLAADYAAVRPLPHPVARALAMAPFALVALVAAPWWFEPRVDLLRLGWAQAWGWSLAQSIAGVALVAAALREAVPGRAWHRVPLTLWLAAPVALVVIVTFTTYDASPIALRGAWATVGAMCLAGSLATALPGAVLSAVLAARAYPTRPALTGLLGGLGAGLMADAGWRLFCHFSEPAHVLIAHLGGVLAAGLCGALLSQRLQASRQGTLDPRP
jgi:hypothetical protein